MAKFLVALNIIIWSFVGYQVNAIAAETKSAPAETKSAPKFDCSQKKNEKRIQCKEAPKSKIKPDVKKPDKVKRKAPTSVKKKADAENAKK